MPKVKTFKVKASVKGGIAKIDYESKQENPEVEPVSFDSAQIARYAQEVSEFNNIETSSIEKMGDDEYEIEVKIIV